MLEIAVLDRALERLPFLLGPPELHALLHHVFVSLPVLLLVLLLGEGLLVLGVYSDVQVAPLLANEHLVSEILVFLGRELAALDTVDLAVAGLVAIIVVVFDDSSFAFGYRLSLCHLMLTLFLSFLPLELLIPDETLDLGL